MSEDVGQRKRIHFSLTGSQSRGSPRLQLLSASSGPGDAYLLIALASAKANGKSQSR